jgi:hypothetical protein
MRGVNSIYALRVHCVFNSVLTLRSRKLPRTGAPIAAGAYGTVSRSRGGAYALKHLSASPPFFDADARTLLCEVRALASLQNSAAAARESLARCVSVCCDPSSPCLVMALVDGGTLLAFIEVGTGEHLAAMGCLRRARA